MRREREEAVALAVLTYEWIGDPFDLSPFTVSTCQFVTCSNFERIQVLLVVFFVRKVADIKNKDPGVIKMKKF